MVDDDLEVAVRAALVLERVLDLGYRALERREVVLAHGRRAVGVEDRLAVLEANRLRANREARTSVSIRHRNREWQGAGYFLQSSWELVTTCASESHDSRGRRGGVS